jgi:histidinol-phosphate aminotransferase
VGKELAALGFDVIPSMANFLFVTCRTMKALDLFVKLRERDIFVRHFNRPRINNYLRISIGTDEEMELLLNAASDILGAPNQRP